MTKMTQIQKAPTRWKWNGVAASGIAPIYGWPAKGLEFASSFVDIIEAINPSLGYYQLYITRMAQDLLIVALNISGIFLYITFDLSLPDGISLQLDAAFLQSA